MPTDAEIVRRVSSGDTEAFGSLVARHEKLIVSICRSMLGDEHDALDAAQDTFVRAYLNIGQLRDAGSLQGWLRRIARSVCANRRKRRGRGVAGGAEPADVPDSAPSPAEQAEAKELRQAVLGAIAALPARYRQPLEMFYVDGASGAEIAGQLGLQAGAVRTRLSRGRDLLRQRLAPHWTIETLSRSKQSRRWLPLSLAPRETPGMKLTYETSSRDLLRGDAAVTIRPMTREDIPAVRTYDRELTATLDAYNAACPPGGITNDPGGPWSDDQWLTDHFEKYQRHGGLTLLAVEDSGRIVGFADLWPTEEPEPFGRSLNVECLDYFREYYLAGLESILLVEAEKVARRAHLPALDVGTNTCSGEYTSLRRFGLKVFYEYDNVVCRCPRGGAARPARHMHTAATADLSGLIRASHWSPTDFTFRPFEERAAEGQYIAEMVWPDRRAVLELWRYERGRDDLPIPEHVPNKSELYVQPEALSSPELMTEILVECAALARETGAEQIPLPCPSDVDVGAPLDVVERQFAFAWLRKRL
ncbi:MAG TPA: sigma-70 family RNA polymerase sigma factor [Phycisphaerae bacterium]|nr:sigma-70 family RNA polymerase sigma factor [Phycisphaerae bacterium]